MLWRHISLLCKRVVPSGVRSWIQLQRIQLLTPLGTTRLHNRLICRHNTDYVNNDEHNRTIIIALAKHWTAPWWWFLREPKHVGVTVGILTVLIFLWFYNCVHQMEQEKVLCYLFTKLHVIMSQKTEISNDTFFFFVQYLFYSVIYTIGDLLLDKYQEH
jgi:hypothetical protein